MDYKLSEIEFVEAVVLSGYKTDVQVQVTIKLKKAIDVENLQVKLVSNLKGFNQIDKRWVDKYVEMWSIPNDVVKLLKKYTGELKPTIKNPKDNRRTFVNGEVIVTKQGNIKIGRITMQRKGGDGGRETAKMLQFKINPAELFEIKNN